MAEEADSDEITNMDDAMCYYVYFFQKELGITLDSEYKVARFLTFQQEAKKAYEKHKKEMNKKNGK